MALPFRCARPLLLAALITACGGGGDTSPPTSPPPPPPPPTPAAVSVAAGDGQQGEPNTSVATAPSVVVRSSSGAGVPNVAVTFAVDSGGGSVGTPTATTDANGVATAGSWRLGATEGPQVLTATVASLTPVRIRATVRIVPKAIGGGTVTSAGGTVTVDQPGSPLNGLRITVPAGALASNASLSLSIASTAGMALRPGVTATSAALVLTTSTGRLKQPATVRFPVARNSAQTTFVAIRNPTTGAMTILPPLGSDSVSVSALLYAMDASQIPAPTAGTFTSALSTRVSGLADPVGLFTIRIDDPAILANPYDSQFRARRDNWDFEALPIAWLPFLPGAAEGDQETEEIDPSAGMIATALWYFENRKSDGPLYNRFRLQRDQAYSNKMGIRWSALANRELPDANAELSASWKEWLSNDPAVFAKTQLDGLKVLFYLERERPIPVLLFSNTPVAEVVGVGIATRVSGDEVRIVVANNSESEYVAKVLPTGLRPFTVLDRNGTEAFTVNGFSALLNRTMTDGPAVGSNWGRVVAGTLGDAEGWPSPTLHFSKGELDTTAAFLADTLSFWWQCASCPDYGLRAPSLPTASHLQVFFFGRKIDGAMGPFPTDVIRAGARWRGDSVTSDVTPTVTGHAVFLPQTEPSLPDKVLPGWLDWKTVTFKRTSLRPSPAALEIGRDTTATFNLSPTTALPAGTRYSWVLRTDDGRDSAETSSGTHTRNLKLDKPGKLLITAHEAGNKRPIARDSIEIKALTPVAAWRLTSFVDADTLFDEDFPPFDLWADLISRPGSGLLIVEAQGADTLLRLRVKRSGVWSAADCCPVASFNPALERELLLGARPARTETFGAYFARWSQTFWSQSTSNLNSGTYTGTAFFPPTRSWTFEGGGSQIGPSNGLNFSATRNGVQLSGVITAAFWPLDFDTREIEGAPEFARLLITATRLR